VDGSCSENPALDDEYQDRNESDGARDEQQVFERGLSSF
jgi:hypothetical protein